ncbi:MAG: NAD(P)H-dependent glycerol-3-phosphate dehydrogenase [Alphaproteobacteria bacterium]
MTENIHNICVLGGGSWGCALASALAYNAPDHPVKLWLRDQKMMLSINQEHQNPNYLPDIALAPNLIAFNHAADALDRASLVIVLLPLQSIRSILPDIAPFIPQDAVIIMGSKGIEQHRHLLAHQIIKEILPDHQVMALSGPSFAREVALKLPTALVLASQTPDYENCKTLAQALSSERLRLYASNDLLGVELSAALKNVYAIAAGLCIGAGFGENARASILCRALVELERMIVAAGGKQETLYGLAGLGDLLLTATSLTSRNTKFGYELGRGAQIPAKNSNKALVEGKYTASEAKLFAKRLGVDTPILDAIAAILAGDISIAQAANILMIR